MAENTHKPSPISSIMDVFQKYWSSDWNFPLFLVIGLRATLTIWLAAAWFFVDPFFPGPEVWQSEGFYTIAPQSTLIGRMLIDVWLRWDAVHFINIAQYGYDALAVTSRAFFPGYPYLVRGITSLAFLSHASTAAVTTVSLIVSTISTAVAVIAFQELVIAAFKDKQLARWTVLVWLSFPTSFFLFAPYSDTLFAALTISALLAIQKKNWITCGILVSLAGITRSQGILLIIPVIGAVVIDLWKGRSHLSFPHVLAVVLSPTGWLAYNLWLQSNNSRNLMNLYNTGWELYITDPFTAFFQSLNYALNGGRDLIFFVIPGVFLFCGVLIWMLTEKRFWAAPTLIIYSVITLGSFLVWGCDGCSAYIGILRYWLSVYPVFIGLTILILRLPSRARRILVAFGFCASFVSSLLFSFWVFVG